MMTMLIYLLMMMYLLIYLMIIMLCNPNQQWPYSPKTELMPQAKPAGRRAPTLNIT